MYELHRLGWSNFQDLCLTISREILGQTVQGFLDTSDGGRDGAFTGTWKGLHAEDLSGAFVIQCKFTSKANKNLTLSDVRDELAKAKALVARGVCDNYILMTNAGLSGTTEEELRHAFTKVGVAHFVAFGATWISQQLRESKRLRMLVPRVYGLGDLTQIIDERAYEQASAVLEAMREDLGKVVITDAYRRAVGALNNHNFVLLVGEPAAGKSTIASLLAVAALDQWGGSVIKADNPSNVIDHWNPLEASQFFWVDDAFGVNQYDSFIATEWNRIFPQIKAILHKGAKLVMTSRDYIFNRARNDLRLHLFPQLLESQVVIDVEDLKLEERRQVLYNHLKMGRQPRAFLTSVKPHLEGIAQNARFSPETARRLADPMFTQRLWVSSQSLEKFVEKREQFLREVIEGLDSESRAALGLIFVRNGSLHSPIELEDTEANALQRLGGSLAGTIPALEALKGSLVSLKRTDSGPQWEFRHPTIGDAYAEVLARGPEYIEVFLRGSSPDVMMSKVTCGDVGLENALVVPQLLYPLVIAKLNSYRRELSEGKWYTANRKDRVYRFLSYRCSRQFLRQYLNSDLEWFSDVSNPGLMLSACSEVGLAVRLHELQLLPEPARKGFVETVSEYVLQGDDAGPLSDTSIRRVFTATEYDALISNVVTKLIPRLGDVREEWQWNAGHQDDVADYLDSFLDILDSLEEALKTDPDAVRVVERERSCAQDWLSENTSDESGSYDATLESLEALASSDSRRSIFDDVDV